MRGTLIPIRCKRLSVQDTSEAMPTPKLLDQVRIVARVKHFSLSTERAYVGWIRRLILFHHKKHPKEIAESEIRQFIPHLAVNAKISASTQTVALIACSFFTAMFRKQELPYVKNIERAKPAKKTNWTRDSGVARETHLPQAILFHAFSVKMRAMASAVPVLSRRAQQHVAKRQTGKSVLLKCMNKLEADIDASQAQRCGRGRPRSQY